MAPASALLPAKAVAGGASNNNDPVECLTDGKVPNGYGPIFANGIECGMHKLDLATVKSIAQAGASTWNAIGIDTLAACTLLGQEMAMWYRRMAT